MQFNRVIIRDTRIIESTEFSPGPGINYFVGENGAGKTSVLEGIHVLSTGTSFRTRSPAKLIRFDQPGLQAFAEFSYRRDRKAQRIGVQRSRTGDTRVKINGEPARRLSDLTQHIPLLALHPESHQLIAAGPSLRRKLIDWGVFHVEQSFIATWREYKRVLDQRNAALKQGADLDTVTVWDSSLAETGERLHRYRMDYLEALIPFLRQALRYVEWGDEVNLALRRGWSEDASLAAELHNSLSKDRTYRTTHPGPHRAELIVKHGTEEIRHTFSRGQQKLFVYLLRMAQADHIASVRDIHSVFLCDDLPAELDQKKRTQVCQQLLDSGYQVFATSVERLPDEFQALECRVFHVEHGRVHQMV